MAVAIVLAGAAGAAGATVWTPQTIPNPQTRARELVADPDGILTATDRGALNAVLTDLERSTTIEYAVVVVGSIGKRVPKEFATELFKAWGIGKKGKDNGLLLLVVLDQRRWEFENGYGLEGVLPDATLARMGRDTLPPYFREKSYGPGLLMVSRKVATTLMPRPTKGPPTEQERRRAAEWRETARQRNEAAAREERVTLALWAGGGLLLYALIAFALRSSAAREYARQGGSFSRRDDELLLPPTPWWVWLLLTFGWVPVGAGFFLWLWDPPALAPTVGDALMPYVPWIAAGTVYLWLAVLTALDPVRKGRLALAEGGDPYVQHKRFTESQASLLGGLLFFPWFFIPYWVYSKRKARALRRQPRDCAECGQPLTRLGEREDDVHLDKGQRLEEELGSIDYDAWFCRAGEHVLILPYSRSSKYTSCEACGYKTSRVTRSWTVRSPDYDSAGQGAQTHECRNCGRTKETTYTIPRLTRPTPSSSSSSSSSSSGGSFGGGRSGGAGAGGSW